MTDDAKSDLLREPVRRTELVTQVDAHEHVGKPRTSTAGRMHRKDRLVTGLTRSEAYTPLEERYVQCKKPRLRRGNRVDQS